MTTCRRFHRVGNDFALCVNIGKKDYVLAENPIDSNTIFYYGIKGIGKLGTMFSEDYVLVKENLLMLEVICISLEYFIHRKISI